MKLLLLILATSLCLSLPAAPLAVHGYPDVAYRAEKATFIFAAGTPDAAVVATLDGAEIARTAVTEPQTELNLALPGPGELVIRNAATAYTFRVVAPDTEAALREYDGALLTDDGTPVVLLAAHNLPPEIDRTWQTVEIVRDRLRDGRPQLQRLALVGGRWLGNAPGDFDDPAWRMCDDSGCLYEIHDAIVCRQHLAAGETPCLGLSASDLERGMQPRPWRMKVEWYAQAVAARPPGGFVTVSLPLRPDQVERFPAANTFLRLATVANGGIFVNGFFERLDGPLTATGYRQRITPHLERVFRLP